MTKGGISLEQKPKRNRNRKATADNDIAALNKKRQAQLMNSITSMFKKIENAQAVIEYK